MSVDNLENGKNVQTTATDQHAQRRTQHSALLSAKAKTNA